MNTLVAFVHKELQTGIFLFQIFQPDDLRGVIGTVHIVDMEFLKVADNDPAGVHIVGEITGIAACLLEGGQHRAVGLLVALPKVNICALLLDQHPGVFNIAVNKAGMIQFYPYFKFNGIGGLLHAEHILQKGDPKPLGLLLFVTVTRPILHKLFCR